MKTTRTGTENVHAGWPRCGQRGFSLIEVVVAAAIFSLGLGSMSLLLIMAVHGTQAPRSETLAALYAQSLTDALRLVPDGDVTAAAEPADCTPPLVCPPSTMAWSIMESWRDRVERDLPTGRGLVCRDSTSADSACAAGDSDAVTISWREVEPESGAESTRAFTLDLPVP